jgi:putative phosphoribosyl transferase
VGGHLSYATGAARRAQWGQPGAAIDATTLVVQIPCEAAVLQGDLAVPRGCSGVVLFAHGSGSSRRSPRNRLVAGQLRQRGLATLLFDLLTAQEEQVDGKTRALRFDLPLLATRLVCATRWAAAEPRLDGLPLGYFGASTGSAAALIAAARLGPLVGAVVSRGGRPDLAGASVLERLRCPTLLIVGGWDAGVIALNEQAQAHLQCAKALAIVPGATHLFEEPGALDQVCRLAGDWLRDHLVRADARTREAQIPEG